MININNVKLDIVEKLKPLNLDKIILFGSFAYGTPNEDSDLDICIVDDNYTSRIDKKLEIRKKLKDIKISKDILLVNNTYYQSHSDSNWLNTALYDARHKGEVLYEKN